MKELTFNENEIIVSKTDLKGIITYGNDLFIKISGYKEQELLGAPHNIIRHKDMPRSVFKLLWTKIAAGDEVNAYVVNKAKSGDYYWVYANVTPSLDPKGNIIAYYSVRRKPEKKALDIIKPLYKQLIQAEARGGMQESGSMLNDLLSSKRTTYEEFVLSI